MNYSKIISNSIDEKNKKDPVSNKPDDKYELNPTPKMYKKQSVMNIIPHTSNNSYGVWERTYFKHILDLYDIFCRHISKLDNTINTRSIDFLDNFCRFIRENSSGEIDLYVEDLSEHVEKLYEQFTIKRNESV